MSWDSRVLSGSAPGHHPALSRVLVVVGGIESKGRPGGLAIRILHASKRSGNEFPEPLLFF
jgi:hypothetical protein